MNIIWGVILIIFTGVLCWLMQVISAFWPAVATKLGVMEPEADVDPIFYVDVQGEAFWDMVTLWTLPVAGILLMFNSP